MSKTKQQNLKDIAKRYGMYFIFLMAGIPLGSFGDVYFVDNPEATNFTVHDELPTLESESINPLNDDLNEDEKQTLWRFDMVEISEMDTLRGKGLPTYVKADNTILQNIYVWTIT